MEIKYMLYDLLFGRVTFPEEARKALEAQGLPRTFLDETSITETPEDLPQDDNPYAPPKISEPEQTRSYFRGLKIEQLASGETVVSGRLVIENPIAYKEAGQWRPEVISSRLFRKTA